MHVCMYAYMYVCMKETHDSSGTNLLLPEMSLTLENIFVPYISVFCGSLFFFLDKIKFSVVQLFLFVKSCSLFILRLILQCWSGKCLE